MEPLCRRVVTLVRVAEPSSIEGLKALLDFNPEALYRFDEKLSYMLKPNFKGLRHGSHSDLHHTNSRSLLGKDEVDLDPGTRKILFLGDSVGYGYGLKFDEVFTSLMQTQAGEGIQILNGSCSGWSSLQELTFFHEYLADIDWDLVVLVFCLNDLINYEWVYESSSSYRLSAEADSLMHGSIDRSLEAIRMSRLRNKLGSQEDTAPLATLHNIAIFAWDDARWDQFEKTILHPLVSDDLRKKLLVVAMPVKPQLASTDLGAPPELVFFPQRRLEAMCRELGIHYLDAAEAFSSPSRPADEWFQDNFHFTARGHQRLAEYLLPQILSQVEKSR